MVNNGDHLLKFWNLEKNHNYSINLFKVLGKGIHKVKDFKYDSKNDNLYINVNDDKIVILSRRDCSDDNWIKVYEIGSKYNITSI